MAYAAPATAQAPGPATNGETSSQQFLQPLVVWPRTYYPAPEWTECSCVEYAKWRLGFGGQNIAWGNARDMKPNTTSLEDAELVLTDEGPGHVLIKKQVYRGNIETDEANWEECEVTSRDLPIDSPHITGLIDIDLW